MSAIAPICSNRAAPKRYTFFIASTWKSIAHWWAVAMEAPITVVIRTIPTCFSLPVTISIPRSGQRLLKLPQPEPTAITTGLLTWSLAPAKQLPEVPFGIIPTAASHPGGSIWNLLTRKVVLKIKYCNLFIRHNQWEILIRDGIYWTVRRIESRNLIFWKTIDDVVYCMPIRNLEAVARIANDFKK